MFVLFLPVSLFHYWGDGVLEKRLKVLSLVVARMQEIFATFS